MEQRILQRSIWISGSRVNHQTGRLVNDYDLPVFEQDLQRNRLRQAFDPILQFRFENNGLSTKQLIARTANRLTIPADPALADPVL